MIKGILAAITAMAIVSPAIGQTYNQTPTVRYEGRPVEDIVKDGVPVRNYDGDRRIIVDGTTERIRRPRPPVYIAPAIIPIHKPWLFNLPYAGGRYYWAKIGYDAVLIDSFTGQFVSVRRYWFG